METRQLTIDVLVDEATGFGKWNDLLVKVDETGQFTVQGADAVADAYLAAGVKVPVEFVEVRSVIEGRINGLQAVL